jgi:methyl-accepting chemotaxis protein
VIAKIKAFWVFIRPYLLVACIAIAIGAIIAIRIFGKRNQDSVDPGSIQSANQSVGRIQADIGSAQAGAGQVASGIGQAKSAATGIADGIDRIQDSTDRSTEQLDRLDQLNTRFADLIAEIKRGNTSQP